MAYIEMRNITKVYPTGVVANDHVSLSIEKGEIHAVAGENGAGKSTIMKVLYGAERADGEIVINGQRVNISSPRDANALHIGMVYQHFMLVEQFKVWENIFFGNEDAKALGILDKASMCEKAKALCAKYDMPLDVEAKCADLTVSEAQKVEILKVLARGAEIIILDEPTAVLTPQETDQFFDQLRLLRDSGCTVIIITHKLREIMRLCDRVTVMRQGKAVGTHDIKDITELELSRLMVGRDIKVPAKTAPNAGECVLSVSDLTVKGDGKRKAVNGVGFEVRRGEILCVAGVEGNGQHEVVNAITGMDRLWNGKISFMGCDVAHMSISDIRAKGMAYIPEDRLKTGAIADFSVHENLIADDFRKNSVAGFMKMGQLKKRSRRQVGEFEVKGSVDDSLGGLSGGNMQKVIIARELEGDPVLVVADQPTRGVDIGAIESIHAKIVEMRDSGKAVFLVSADLSEVMTLADRILVFHNGEITAEITDVASATEEQLGRYMLGVERMEGLS